jgi:hypothetical protein
MKQLIVLIAILPIMLIFVMQFGLEQQNNSRIIRFENYVSASKELAKQEGYFSEANINSLKSKIAQVFDITDAEVFFEGTITPKYRVNQFDERELIYYKVGVPIKKIMAGGALMGISKIENQGYYVIDSFTSSECLMP